MNDNKLALNEESRPLWQLLNTQPTMHKFELACGQEAGSVMINIINAANNNPAIWECEPNSVVTAALNCAAMSLSLAPSLGQGCILPFNKNTKIGNQWVSEKRAVFVPMLRGVKAMALRTGKYIRLNAFKVYEGQEWVEDQRAGVGNIEGAAITEEVIGYGAYFRLVSGLEATVYMTANEVMAHAKKYSPTYDKREGVFRPGSRWITDFDDMALKTVMKSLILNKGVISDKDRAALEQLDTERVEGEVIDQESETTEKTADNDPGDVLPIPDELVIPWNMTGKDGVKFGELPDEEIQKRIGIIEGMTRINEENGAILSALRQIKEFRAATTGIDQPPLI